MDVLIVFRSSVFTKKLFFFSVVVYVLDLEIFRDFGSQHLYIEVPYDLSDTYSPVREQTRRL